MIVNVSIWVTISNFFSIIYSITIIIIIYGIIKTIIVMIFRE